MDRRVVVETSGEHFPIVTVSGMSSTDQQAGDLCSSSIKVDRVLLAIRYLRRYVPALWGAA
jgi:hypothetical protein